MRFKRLLILLIFVLTVRVGFAQCLENVGFEKGTFVGWKCYTGTFPDNTGTTPIIWTPVAGPVDGNYTISIIPNTSPQSLDKYGHFPVNTPNGSKYSLQLGNDAYSGGGTRPAWAERVTYDFIVPTNDYTLIYYYAVVFQNPITQPHDQYQQPQFIANVNNLDNPSENTGQCGSFSFYGKPDIRGFMKSDAGNDVLYKPWAPIIVKIANHQGKHFQLEFISRDCSKGGHFGYAYLDFNEANCNSPITGNLYCANQDVITLTAPPGFETYKWTNDKDSIVSTEPTYKIHQPFPGDGTKYNLSITPYDGQGCPNAFTTSITKLSDEFILKVRPDTSGCKADGIDLTQAPITAGSSADMKFEYYTDPDGQNYLSDPKHVTESGDYYIRGTNAGGCTGIAPIHVNLYKGSDITIAPHPAICAPATYNLTKLASTNDVVTYTYYSDVYLKIPMSIAQASAIAKTGTYYIKATTVGVPCITVEAVGLIVSDLPIIPAANDTTRYGSCPPLDLNKSVIGSSDNSTGITYKFYSDKGGTKEVTELTNITISGRYWFKAINQYGCESDHLAPIKATVYPTPAFKVTDPAPVVYPQTINLMDTHVPLTYANFTYWKDAAATKPLDNYQTIGESGNFYIKAVNTTGCVVIQPVHVLVNAPPEANLIVPNTFTPNGDGINDEFKPTTTGVIKLNYIKIFNRYGKEIFNTTQLYNRWNGTIDGKPEPAGTYYWLFSAYDIFRKKQVMKSGSVTIVR
ncbi:MAG: gliding motility-associated C-terminal domain-containing protein [Bacteroidota bacterium]